MNPNSSHQQNPDPRILLFSHRNIVEQLVWRCPFREFEKIIQEVDSVDLVAPSARTWYGNGKRAALRLGELANIPINPGVSKVNLDRDYDMFFTICDGASDLLHLKALKGWRDRCKTTVCWLPEFYVKDIPVYKSCIEVLKQFDYVIFMFVANEPFRKIIKGQGQYLPAGIDTLRFCPCPDPPTRSIDVLSIGRRAPVVHKALMRMAQEDGKFYVYDTINALRAYDLDEHRLMIANLAKRSRYFIVSPGKFDKPEETGGQIEFGYRYFEAAAPGTIMIGMRCANNKEFDKIFNWEDAVIEVPFTSDAIVDTIRELDKQPERQMKISQTNILQCLLHHDWVYRWEAVLNFVGMQPLPMLQGRKQRLNDLAEIVKEAPFELQNTRVR
ncbi:MAG: glycosyltransferase [Terriglobales bacterium]